MHHHRLAALALAALLLPALAAAQTWSAVLSWQHDGVGVDNFRVLAGRSPSTLGQVWQSSDSLARMASIDALAPGVWYFAATAVAPSPSRAESARSNVACVALGTGACPPPPVLPPDAVRNLVVTAVATPPPAPITVTVRFCGTPIDWCQLVATGTGTITLRTSNGVIDMTDFPQTPALGTNNDGLNSPAITFTAPSGSNGWWFETDNVTNFASITVNGVTIPMTFANGAWTARTP